MKNIRILLLAAGLLFTNHTLRCQDFTPPDMGNVMLSPGAYSMYRYDRAGLADETPFHSLAISINPLGLLQFGPMFQIEARLAGNLYLVPHFRYGYTGVLTWLDWGGFDENTELSPINLGVGLGGRYLHPVGEKNNAMYLGGLAEYNIGSARYDLGEAWATEETFSGINLFSNIGYRWRSSSGMFLNVGIYAGFAVTLKNELRRIDNGELEDDYDGIFFGGGAELSFGWEF